MYDAIVILGGGVREGGTLPEWVQRRFDYTLHRWQGEPLLCLSAGTILKPLPRDAGDHPIFESVAGARYLVARGVPPTHIFTETASYDTIGNAYFARVIHADPLGWRHLLVITSEFHITRTRAIFEWVFGLSVVGLAYQLTFEAVTDTGLDPDLVTVRHAKEVEGLANLLPVLQTIRTLPDLHHFLFTRHDAYAVARLAQRQPTVSEEIQKLY